MYEGFRVLGFRGLFEEAWMQKSKGFRGLWQACSKKGGLVEVFTGGNPGSLLGLSGGRSLARPDMAEKEAGSLCGWGFLTGGSWAFVGCYTCLRFAHEGAAVFFCMVSVRLVRHLFW